MKSLKEQLSEYSDKHLAIPAFNIDSFEIYQAVEAAVMETSLPCIAQVSAGEDRFITAEKLYLLVKKANLEGLPIYLNMDHGRDLERLRKVSHLGFDMVHFDGSSLSYIENTAKSVNFINTVHPQSLVELEFDEIGSNDFTSPEKALDFITQTRADLLAVSIGNRHGNNPAIPEIIDLNELSKIHLALPHTFLTLHGGSGISTDQIKAALKLGIVKININTDLRLAFISALRRELSSSSTEKIYELFAPAVATVKEVIKQKLLSFSSIL